MNRAFALISRVLVLLLVVMPLGAAPVAAVAGGPIVLMGIDAEDGGPGGHGPIANYTSITNSVLANVTNGGSGIVVFGGDPAPCGGTSYVQDFWNAIGPAATPAQTVTYAIGATAVATQSLAAAAVMVVSSDYLNTFCGGLTQAEHDALTLRQADIAAFVNAGGGLIAFASDFSNPYAWITTVGSFTVTTGLSYLDITPTAAGTAIGVTNDLDVCCWHDVYNTFPSFLSVLATDASSGAAAALGGASVIIPPENCTDGIDNDNDGLIDGADPDCQNGSTETSASGTKYFDANTNGQLDVGEAGLANWPIDYDDGSASASVLTDANGNFSVDLSAGTYTFAERQGGAPWFQTGNSVDQSGGTAEVTLNPDMTYTVTLDAGETATGLNFGNVCVGAGGGRTLGFWSNKNGQKLIGADDLALLVSLNLVKADGTPFNPTTNAQVSTWLRDASAKNMAYMLSAQLAAMALNVHNGLVDGSSLVYAPGTTSANAAGFATVDDLIAEANAELGLHPTAFSGAAWRGYQGALKDALDDANNNRTFVQDDATTCAAPFSEAEFNLYADGSVSCVGADDLSRVAGSATFVESTGQVLFSVSLAGAAPNATYDLNISEEPTCSNVESFPAAITTDATGNGSFSGSFDKAPGTYNFLVNFVTSPAPSDPTNREIATTDTSVTVH